MTIHNIIISILTCQIDCIVVEDNYYQTLQHIYVQTRQQILSKLIKILSLIFIQKFQRSVRLYNIITSKNSLSFILYILSYSIQQFISLNIMQQQPNFVQMAAQIHNLTVYNKFYQMMNNFEVIQHVFMNQVDKSSQLLFAATEMLSKKLIKNQLMIVAQQYDNLTTMTMSQKSPQNPTQKKRSTLLLISRKLHSLITTPSVSIPQYITRSCINAISLCINTTINSTPGFQASFVAYVKLLAPDFVPNQHFIKPSNTDTRLHIINGSQRMLGLEHAIAVQVFLSLLDYILNSAYYPNYYYFRRNLYSFRNHYLAYLLNYSIFCIKSLFKSLSMPMLPVLKLFQSIILYPFSLNMHQFQIEDQMHENISGLQTEIYFPSYFRSVLCDTGLLVEIVAYYGRLEGKWEQVRQEMYLLIRVIGRVMSAAEYIFVGEIQKKTFRMLCFEFVNKILKDVRYWDGYLVLCISKINIKFMSVENQDELFQGKREYFDHLCAFICNGLVYSEGKIQDGDKHPYRQLFQMLTAFVNITANTVLDQLSKNCAQQALNILLKNRLVDNNLNQKMMKQFGYNNSQQVDCFGQIFARVPQIFKIKLQQNLQTLKQLNLSALSNASLTFWLHLTALLLPENDASIQQTQLILKFLQAAIEARSIGSLHFISTLMSQILYQIQQGVSSTYLWTFIQQSKQIKFQQFLSYIIEYAMKILTVPNYTLIQNCLQLFKTMFSKLCKHRHRSFGKYFQIIQEVCKEIDKTMLVHSDYIKLRIGFFSIISIIWVNQGQIGFVYRIFDNVRQALSQNRDFVHFIRYLTDITGLLQPVQSSEVFKIMLQLTLIDMQSVLPYYLGTPQKLSAAFSQQIFLKTFIKFILTIVSDHGFRLSIQVHTELPFKIQQTFRPYIIQSLKYDYPQKTVQLFQKFNKLNPLGPLLPLSPTLKQKNSPHYKPMLRDYFQNLHRLQSQQQFLYIYSYIDDNIEFLTDWWQQIMIRGMKPDIRVSIVANARIWTNNRQKEQMGKLLWRIAKYDHVYWGDGMTGNLGEGQYGDWFVRNWGV